MHMYRLISDNLYHYYFMSLNMNIDLLISLLQDYMVHYSGGIRKQRSVTTGFGNLQGLLLLMPTVLTFVRG